MNMIRHNHECPQIVVPQLHAFVNSPDHDLSYARVSKIHGTAASIVQFPVHPYESLARGKITRRWSSRGRQTAVEVPGQEEISVLAILMGKAALRHALDSLSTAENSQNFSKGVETSLDAACTSAYATSLVRDALQE
jgi:hypothetical protein